MNVATIAGWSGLPSVAEKTTWQGHPGIVIDDGIKAADQGAYNAVLSIRMRSAKTK